LGYLSQNKSNRNPPLAYARGISGGYKTIFNKGGICKIPADFPHNSEYPPCNFIFCHGGSGVLFCRTDNVSLTTKAEWCCTITSHNCQRSDYNLMLLMPYAF
jgi:hypothetical protein